MQISIVISLFLNFDNTHDKGTTVSPEFTRNSTIESYRSVGSSAGKERGRGALQCRDLERLRLLLQLHGREIFLLRGLNRFDWFFGRVLLLILAE